MADVGFGVPNAIREMFAGQELIHWKIPTIAYPVILQEYASGMRTFSKSR